MDHTQACRDAFAQYAQVVTQFWRAYPQACRTCSGVGGFTSTYDPSPAGVSLGSGFLYDTEPCQDCEGHELPTCALCGQICAEDGERLCACPHDASPGPECFCSAQAAWR